MIGAILGDIVGSRFEGKDPWQKGMRLITKESHPTDDTIMTLAIGEALVAYRKKGGDLGSHAIREIRKWGRKYMDAGYGASFLIWLCCDDPKPYYSWGNGAAMRVSACGWAAKSCAEAVEFARKVTEVTHDHPEAIIAAETIAALIYLARTGASKNELQEYVESHYVHIDFAIDEIKDSYEFDTSCQGSVPQAIAAFLESTSVKDTLEKALSIGGDSDTIAAIACSIAEAYYGIGEKTRLLVMRHLDSLQLRALEKCERELLSIKERVIMKKYACYNETSEEILAGTPIGDKQDVLEWAKRRYGRLHTPEMVSAKAFFTDRDASFYQTEDGFSFVIDEIH